MQYIDTNIIIRYITQDDPEKAKRVYALFQALDRGEETICITEAVITEVIFVLSSKRLYNLARPEIVKRLLPILLLKGVHIGCKPTDKTIYPQSLHVYQTTTLDITDAIILTKAQQEEPSTVVSFDTDFDQFPEVTRREP